MAEGIRTSIQARISQIQSQAEDTTSDYDREKLEERAAKLSGGVSVLRVGASTEIELVRRSRGSKTRFPPAGPPWRKESFQVAGLPC